MSENVRNNVRKCLMTFIAASFSSTTFVAWMSESALKEMKRHSYSFFHKKQSILVRKCEKLMKKEDLEGESIFFIVCPKMSVALYYG